MIFKNFWLNLNNNKKSTCLFLIFLIIYYFKSPYIFLQGRFMRGDAEMLSFALNNSWIDTITFVYWNAGYINLFSNIISVINAKLINLENAAFFNIYSNFLINLTILYLILFEKSFLFKSYTERFLVSLIVVISPIFVFEIWLDNLNAQVYLGILTLLVLLIYNKKSKIYFYLPIIILSGLTGIYSCLLMPAFFLKAYFTKNKFDYINFSAILITSLIQLSLIFYSKISQKLFYGKLNTDFFLNTNELISYSYNILIRPFFSTSFSNFIIDDFLYLRSNYFLLIVFSVISFLILLMFLINFIKILITTKKDDKILLIILLYYFISSSVLVTIGGVNDWVGGRYSVIPSFCLTLMIIKLIFINSKSFLRFVYSILIIFSLINGMYDFQNSKYVQFYKCINCAHWKDEVHLYKKDKNHKVRVWPNKREVDLNLSKFK